MITIGTVRFDFQASNESFARELNGRWDTFYHTSFESVVDEVLSAYDRPDYTITIDSLPLDMGNIDEDRFDKQFPVRLRQALEQYCKEKLGNQQGRIYMEQKDVQVTSVPKSAFEVLAFFLLHGYFPFAVSQEYTNLSWLLKTVLGGEAYHFREFLNSYGHYDFLCRRLVFQFTDEELESIVNVVRPSESNFINLYIRVQIRSYHAYKRSDITHENYRDAVWTLVFAYLFAESGGYFSRKQMVLHTIRGLAAHFNLSLAELVRMLTESIRELEQTVEQLPELWNILKEIRSNMKEEIWALDGNYHTYLMREVLAALRLGAKGEGEYILSRQHLAEILLNADTCRKLLQQLQEREIYLMVAILLPFEKDYVVSYASMLDKHKDAGTFAGRAGSEFRLLKWEFILATLVAFPASAFSRKQFVLSVLQRLAAHYNFSVAELVHLLYTDVNIINGALPPELLSVLQELERLMSPVADEGASENRSTEEWLIILQTPLLARKYIETHTENQVKTLVDKLFPVYSEFIVNYAALLDKGYTLGLLQGKAGGEFSTLKWEFIFLCFFSENRITFHRKIFVYSVLQQLAAHYNIGVITLLDYFMHNLTDVLARHPFNEMKIILRELYDENVLPLADISIMSSKSDTELEYWLLELFGENSTLYLQGKEDYLKKWLVYFLNEKNEYFRGLWKAGRLNSSLILGILNRSSSLRYIWLHKIGDERLITIYHNWTATYATLQSRFVELGFLQKLAEYLSIWMVELTEKKFLAWSEAEIIRFLTIRIKRSAPPGFTAMLEDIHWDKNSNKNIAEIINRINELKKERNHSMENNQISVENAGMVLFGPLYKRLFFVVGYLDENSKFKDEASMVHAIFLLQYFVYGEQREYKEPELYLNKILVGKSDDMPLPSKCELTPNEMLQADGMIKALMSNWRHMEHTSVTAMRRTFLQRKGVVYSTAQERWSVEVEKKDIDVLLGGIPWTFQLFRAPGGFLITVNWR